MTLIVNIYEAKTRLSELVERAAKGEEIVIARAGKAKARLIPAEPKKIRHRTLGFLKGKVRIGRDFDEPLPENLLKIFRGEGD
jgi:prevent-host-death family protein